MLIWVILSIALVVIVLGGFARRQRYSHSQSAPTPSHHGKESRNHRGRGRQH
jgi:hypothetical protein